MFNIYEQTYIMNRTHANMRDTDEYTDILGKSTQAFGKETGFNANFMVVEDERPLRGEDAAITIDFENGPVNFLAEIKLTTNDAVIGRMMHQIHDTNRRWIFVTRYVPVPWAKKLKEAGVQFIDTAGNAYVNEAPALVFIYGNRLQEAALRRVERGVFGITATKILFALFCIDGLENATYREIADVAGVALGGVPATLQTLIHQGFILQLSGGKRKLVKKKELLQKWLAAYIAKIPKKTLANKYTANRDNFWEDVEIGPLGARWGGEVAANKLTHYLKPEIVTLYTNGPIENLITRLKLRKDDIGKIEIRRQFWNFETPAPVRDIVPVLLVYADLLAAPDPRNLETAKMVYDEHLKRYFE